MQRKLTITIDEQVYEELVHPHIMHPNLEAAYQQMAQDEERESLALEWAEASSGSVGDEVW